MDFGPQKNNSRRNFARMPNYSKVDAARRLCKSLNEDFAKFALGFPAKAQDVLNKLNESLRT